MTNNLKKHSFTYFISFITDWKEFTKQDKIEFFELLKYYEQYWFDSGFKNDAKRLTKLRKFLEKL
jgi:hypothetical protein